jgi:hypothetical protein
MPEAYLKMPLMYDPEHDLASFLGARKSWDISRPIKFPKRLASSARRADTNSNNPQCTVCNYTYMHVLQNTNKVKHFSCPCLLFEARSICCYVGYSWLLSRLPFTLNCAPTPLLFTKKWDEERSSFHTVCPKELTDFATRVLHIKMMAAAAAVAAKV